MTAFLERFSLESQPEALRLLEAAWQEANRQWPGVQALSLEAFGVRVAERLGGAPSAALETMKKLHLGDLYLAQACGLGDARAMRHVEEAFMPDVAVSLRGLRLLPAEVDEELQRVREHLFVASDDRPPRIATYSGQGPLVNWLRVVAMRQGLRRVRGASSSEEVQLEHLPELITDTTERDYVRGAHQADVAKAFQEAFESLSDRDRSVLRMRVLDGLSMPDIAAVYRVNPSSVSRWVSRATERVLRRMRRLLSTRLNLTASDVDSLINAVESQLEVSLRGLFGK
jgi:RNA polymerase sigma-70 factor (ECF subfamily)